MTQPPKISVIVPVYNAEKYLHKCIDSILAQIFTDFELLLINDGSQDNSGQICDEYAAKDKRTRVFHKENGGVSSARNMGIENAQGEWIAFVDSDDWVEKEYLNSFFGEQDTNSYDIIIQDCFFETEKEVFAMFNYKNAIILHEDFKQAITDFNILNFGNPFCKLFKRNILSQYNIKFNPAISYGEDFLFLLEYLLNTESILIIGKAYYHYNNTLFDSLSRKYNTFSSEYLYFCCVKKTLDLIKTKKNLDAKSIMICDREIVLRLWRPLSSMYRVGYQQNRSTRLLLLKKMIKNKDSSPINYFSLISLPFFSSVALILFKIEMIKTFDSYMKVSFLLKKLLR